VLYKLRLQRPDVFDKVEGVHLAFVSRSRADQYTLVYIDGMWLKHFTGNSVAKKLGGIHRGTDVIKALCLGAKAVGLGRPFLYAQSVSIVFSWIFNSDKPASGVWGCRRRKNYPDPSEGNCDSHEACWCSDYRRFTPWNGKHTSKYDHRVMDYVSSQVERVDWQPRLVTKLWVLVYRKLKGLTIYCNAWDILLSFNYCFCLFDVMPSQFIH